MNSKQHKMVGLNMWFIIEIMSFYGYILAGVLYIMMQQIKSTMGWLNKDFVEDRYKFDFLHYYKKDLDWMAFVTILFVVNLGLSLINHFIKPFYKTV